MQSSRKLELESRVVGLYAGKAAELLILLNNLSFTSAFAPTKSQGEREFLPKTSLSTKKRVKPNSMIGDSASTLGLKQRNRKVKNKSRALISGIQQSYFYSK